MKSILIITIFLIPAIWSYGQTPSSYDKILLAKINTLDSIVKVQTGQINILVWSNTKMLAMLQEQDEIITIQNANIQANKDDIELLKAGLIVTNSNVEEIKRSIVPFNKITYKAPLKWEVIDPNEPNVFVNSIDIQLLKQMLGLQ